MTKGWLIGQGRDSEVFTWGDDQVLKLFRDHGYARRAEQEADNTRMAREAGLPVPDVEGVVEFGGRSGVVYERIEGPSMSEQLMSKPWAFIQLARVLAELHVAMHTCLVSGLPSQRQQLQRKIWAAELSEDAKEMVLEALSKLPDGNVLCHFDFQPKNVLMSSHGAIIVDWVDATRGNPFADVARTSLLVRLGARQHVGLGLWLGETARALFHSIYLRRYLQLRPALREQISAWQLPVAAARLSGKSICSREKGQLLSLIEASLPR